jgi:hypothetical protein
MSGELRNYLASTVVTGGITRQFGSLVEAHQDAEIDGDVLDDASHTIPDSDATSVALWTYSAAKPDFTQILIFPDGPIDLQIKYDKPTSSTVFTALGTHVNYAIVRLRAHAPHVIGSQDALVVANGATVQTAILGATVAEGRIYEITARKPAASDDDTVTARVVVVN